MNKPIQTLVSRLFKKDGWMNLLAGFGKKNTDKTKDTIYEPPTILVEAELTNLWVGDGLAAKIVSVVPGDMTRKWIDIPGDKDDDILTELDRLDAEEKFAEALTWARLYQGAIIVIGAEGSGDLETPMPLKIKGISYLKVYPSSRVEIERQDFVTDQNSPFFGDVEVFRIQSITGDTLRIHRTRCLVFKGVPVPADSAANIDLKMRYWGMSMLNQIWDRLKNFGAVEQGIANLMYEVVIGKYKLSNLAELLSEKDGASKVYTRMEIINASKSLINGVLLGENEEYTRDTANTTGVPDIIDRFMMILSGITGIPVTKLFGRSPAGENATGESDARNYYDMVASQQKIKLKPPLQELVNKINGYLGATKDPSIVFNSIWELTEREEAEIYKLNAEGDNIYNLMGAITAEEITVMRFPDLVEGRDSDPIDPEEEEEEPTEDL